MSAHGPVFLTTHDSASPRWHLRTTPAGRWPFLAAATIAVVPADEGYAWTTAIAIIAVAVVVWAVLALRRAAAKVDAVLAEELGPPRKSDVDR
ncbi:hypothetical protein MUY14_10150 [Amycolatopsis sp. FBCC-B4732]|uniref:hypothetical protein n=1 Tax=Amycolatopsis sp. FBCC-B4732 TaxID=3079339 RepID=UPI001FF54E68|nr:hypothetical protein [Amycolatopsis sp. FBCC-B4732]UOX90960.1 hypothetical protein MUY14_10150 [Amycolatopsis sp. FBCC-B4732]